MDIFALEIDKTQFLTFSVFCIISAICLQAYGLRSVLKNKGKKSHSLICFFLSVASAALGLMIPTVGMDVSTGAQRFSMGILELYGGIDFIVMVLGLCCIGEILYVVSETGIEYRQNTFMTAVYPIFTVTVFVGAYCVHYRMFDMFLLIAFGLSGFLMRKLNFPITPLVVCAAFGSRIEEAYRSPFSWSLPAALFCLFSLIVIAVYMKKTLRPGGD